MVDTDILYRLEQIELKLDFLINALAMEADDSELQPKFTLEGEQYGGERDKSQEL